MKYYYSFFNDRGAVNIAGDWIGLKGLARIDTHQWERLPLGQAPSEVVEVINGRVLLPAEDIFPELALFPRRSTLELAA